MNAVAEVQPSLSELYRHHRRKALAIARRILEDPDDAEDVVQEVFVRLYLRPDRYEGQSAYSTWLHRVMVNSSINQLRSNRRRSRLRADSVSPLSPEQAAIGAEMKRQFFKALEQLSLQHRQILWLREMRGFSYPEISALMRIPEGTVKSALNRGRLQLQERLESEDDSLKSVG